MIQGIKIVSSQVTLSGSVSVAGTDGVGGGGGGGGGSLIIEGTGACVVKNVDATGGGADTGTCRLLLLALLLLDVVSCSTCECAPTSSP